MRLIDLDNLKKRILAGADKQKTSRAALRWVAECMDTEQEYLIDDIGIEEKWIENPENLDDNTYPTQYACSLCGATLDIIYDKENDDENPLDDYLFCPNCGHAMGTDTETFDQRLERKMKAEGVDAHVLKIEMDEESAMAASKNPHLKLMLEDLNERIADGIFSALYDMFNPEKSQNETLNDNWEQLTLDDIDLTED